MPVDATLVRPPLNPPAEDTAQRWLVTLGRPPARYVAQEHTGANAPRPSPMS